jgi:hypothetical protein
MVTRLIVVALCVEDEVARSIPQTLVVGLKCLSAGDVAQIAGEGVAAAGYDQVKHVATDADSQKPTS